MDFLFQEYLLFNALKFRPIDLIVLGVCLIVVVILLICIISDMKNQRRLRKMAAANTEENAGLSADEYPQISPQEAKKLAKQKSKEDKALEKLNKRKVDNVQSDVVNQSSSVSSNLPSSPIVMLLGFDPYAPIENETCEITETFYDVEQETEDMRILRERIQTARITEKKLETLRQRAIKVKYEKEKTARYIRDNKVVLQSADTVDKKLRDELSALTVDKKTEKRNKASVASLRSEIAKNEQTIAMLSKKVDARTNDERLLDDAYKFLAAEIARTERDLSFINSDVDRLNESVGAELKKIENENRARELMNKYRDLKPLLQTVNLLFYDIKQIDKELESVHEQKNALKTTLAQLMEDAKRTFGATATQEIANKIGDVNLQIVALDEKEEELISKKEDLIAQFRQAKTKANDFLVAEKYDIEDIIIAEDKVIGEIEYEKLKVEYEGKKTAAAEGYVLAQKNYDALASKKVKFGKKQEAQKRAYEEELSQALNELKQSRTACEKAEYDYDRVLPGISPESLIASGSGVMSRDRLSKRNDDNKDRREQEREKARRMVEENDRRQASEELAREQQPATEPAPRRSYARPVRQTASNLPAMPGANGGRYASLLARLDQLEKLAKEEKRQRELQRARRVNTSVEGDKIERKKAELIALRKELNFVNSPSSANEFKRKVHQFAMSLDEDEMRDNLLNEMINRTINEATARGERGNK